MMWDGLRKGSIYSVCFEDTGRKRNHLAKKSQQPKPEITCLTPKLPPRPPFEYTSQAVRFPLFCFVPRCAGGQNKGSEETTCVPLPATWGTGWF